MPDVSKRLESLSPEKRRLLSLLLQKNEASPAPAEPLNLGSSETPEGAKATARKFYNTVSRQLNSTVFGKVSYFLNFGYLPDGSKQYSQVELPANVLNKNSVKLVLEVIGDCDLTGRKVLDLGCGRGGAVSVVHKYFQPESMTGLDLSSEAIAFCRREHRYSNAVFLEGDAERVPFPDNSFDVILNLESSHSYPDLFAFYGEVFRLLNRRGYFLYTDLYAVNRMNENVKKLLEIGFVLEKDRDITRNVLLSCNEISQRRAQAFHEGNNRDLMNEFLAVPGSAVYQDMANGVSTYRVFKARAEK
jgi:ubiquinone/menaquinone biosynthesis C-methylase UbiE